jgi:hypothetical protein
MCGMHKLCSQLNHLLNHEDDDDEDDEEEELDEDEEDEEIDEDDEDEGVFMTFRSGSTVASALPGLFRFFLDFSSPFSSGRVSSYACSSLGFSSRSASTSGDETSS